MTEKATISVEVPAGMTADGLLKLVTQYEAKRVSGKAQRENRNAAIKKLIAAHRPEYDGYLQSSKPKA